MKHDVKGMLLFAAVIVSALLLALLVGGGIGSLGYLFWTMLTHRH